MSARLQSLLGWGVFLGSMLLIVRACNLEASAPGGTERMLAYPLTERGQLRFPLSAGEERVKLVTWLAGPAGWAPDSRSTHASCLEVAVVDGAGAEAARWPLWIRSHASFPDEDLRAAAQLPDTLDAAEDDRVALLDLSGLVPSGGSLDLRPCWLPPDRRLLVVAFHEADRPVALRARLARGAQPRILRDLARTLTARGWTALDEAWRSRLLARRWERLGAVPDAEGGPPTERIESSFARVGGAEASAAGVPVPPGGALAFNLVGEVAWTASWWTLDGRPSEPVPTELRVVGADGRISLEDLGEVSSLPPLDREAGLRSVQVALGPQVEGPRMLRVRTLGGEAGQPWGDPQRGPLEGAGDRRLGPDLRVLELYRAQAEGEPLAFEPIPEGRLRLRMMARLPPGLPGLQPTELGADVDVELRFLDEEGRLIVEQHHPWRAAPSAFERYAQVDDPSLAAVSDPESWEPRPPAGSVRLELRASQPVDLSLRVRDPDDHTRTLVARGYELPPDLQVRGRTLPLRQDPWRPLVPTDLDSLMEAGRMPRVDAQVRLELRDPSGSAEEDRPGSEPPVAVSRTPLPLQLDGRPRYDLAPLELLVEADLDGHTEAGGRVLLGATPATVEVPASGQLRLEALVAEARVGSSLQIEADGKIARLHVPARAFSTRVALAPGPHQVAVRGEAGALADEELVLAEATGEPLWSEREVRRLAPESPFTHGPLPQGPGELSLLVYTVEGVGLLRWRIQDGAQGDAIGPTPREGALLLQPREGVGRVISRGGVSVQPMRRVDIDLGADLGEGARITFSVEGGTAYVRALSTWRELAARPSLRSWWVQGPEGDLE